MDQTPDSGEQSEGVSPGNQYVHQVSLASILSFVSVFCVLCGTMGWQPALAYFSLFFVTVAFVGRLFCPQWKPVKNPARPWWLPGWGVALASVGAVVGWSAGWAIVRVGLNGMDDFQGNEHQAAVTFFWLTALGAYCFALFRHASNRLRGALIGGGLAMVLAVAISQILFPWNTYYANIGHFFLCTIPLAMLLGIVGLAAGAYHGSKLHDVDRRVSAAQTQLAE